VNLGTAIGVTRNASDEGAALLFRHCNISAGSICEVPSQRCRDMATVLKAKRRMAELKERAHSLLKAKP
jgi:hypothetical protein